jgi:tetratricopeptide (TPR) repeat protein
VTENTSNSRIEMLKQYIAEDPADLFSLYALALEYAKAGNNSEAVKILEGVLKKDTYYLAAYYQLGKLHEQSGSVQLAKKVYEKGIDIAQKQHNTKTLNELRSALDSLED